MVYLDIFLSTVLIKNCHCTASCLSSVLENCIPSCSLYWPWIPRHINFSSAHPFCICKMFPFSCLDFYLGFLWCAGEDNSIICIRKVIILTTIPILPPCQHTTHFRHCLEEWIFFSKHVIIHFFNYLAIPLLVCLVQEDYCVMFIFYSVYRPLKCLSSGSVTPSVTSATFAWSLHDLCITQILIPVWRMTCIRPCTDPWKFSWDRLMKRI